VAGALLVPLVAVLSLVGPAQALSLAMGYAACLYAGLKVPLRAALALTVPAALAGAVAVAVSGQALPAAGFVALACLMAAPANMLSNRVIAGIPATLDPAPVAGWMLAGGAYSVLVAQRLRQPEVPEQIDAGTAWRHAIAMAAAVGLATFLVIVLDVPHGYWIGMTLTIVLRPLGAETRSVVRQRVGGTVAGAVLALGIGLLLPGWALVATLTVLMVATVAYALLGDYARQVMFMTPMIVLLGAGSSSGRTEVAAERVLATLVGAVIAAGIALALARYERDHPATRPSAGRGGQVPEPTG
jgi:Fusaric acid resistance protein-like